MKEADFQEKLEALYEDFGFKAERGKSYTAIIAKIHLLTEKYLKEHERDLYRDKCPENGAD